MQVLSSIHSSGGETRNSHVISNSHLILRLGSPADNLLGGMKRLTRLFVRTNWVIFTSAELRVRVLSAVCSPQ